jgi:hypothetical protein
VLSLQPEWMLTAFCSAVTADPALLSTLHDPTSDHITSALANLLLQHSTRVSQSSFKDSTLSSKLEDVLNKLLADRRIWPVVAQQLLQEIQSTDGPIPSTITQTMSLILPFDIPTDMNTVRSCFYFIFYVDIIVKCFSVCFLHVTPGA